MHAIHVQVAASLHQQATTKASALPGLQPGLSGAQGSNATLRMHASNRAHIRKHKNLAATGTDGQLDRERQELEDALDRDSTTVHLHPASRICLEVVSGALSKVHNMLKHSAFSACVSRKRSTALWRSPFAGWRADIVSLMLNSSLCVTSSNALSPKSCV